MRNCSSRASVNMRAGQYAARQGWKLNASRWPGPVVSGCVKISVSAARRYLPVLDWGRDYHSRLCPMIYAGGDSSTIILSRISSLTLLADCRPESGALMRHRPILPLCGVWTSRALAGACGVVSLMTAAAGQYRRQASMAMRRSADAGRCCRCHASGDGCSSLVSLRISLFTPRPSRFYHRLRRDHFARTIKHLLH